MSYVLIEKGGPYLLETRASVRIVTRQRMYIFLRDNIKSPFCISCLYDYGEDGMTYKYIIMKQSGPFLCIVSAAQGPGSRFWPADLCCAVAKRKSASLRLVSMRSDTILPQ
jgi:hypothetical protein